MTRVGNEGREMTAHDNNEAVDTDANWDNTIDLTGACVYWDTIDSSDVGLAYRTLYESGGLDVGDTVTCGLGEDSDTGRIVSIEHDDASGETLVTVAWRSGVSTTQPAEALGQS